MKTRQIALALALVSLVAPPLAPGQALPAGDYNVMRLDFHIGPYNDLQRAILFNPLWTSTGQERLEGTLQDCSILSLVGNTFSLTASGNPFLYTFPWPPPDTASAYGTGFVNAAGTVFSLHDFDLPAADNNLTNLIARIGLGLRRADNLADADLVGDWFHLYWEIGVDDPGLNVLSQGYELAEVQLRADRSGFRDVLKTSFDDEEDIAFSWRADGGDLLVEEGEGMRFPVGASKDLILAPVVEREPGNSRQYLGFDLFMKRAASLVAGDVAGIWGMQFFDIFFGSGTFGNWKSMGSEKALIELRPDLTGTLYTLALSDLQWLDDNTELRMDFTWAIDGGNIVITAPDDDDGVGVHVFPVSAGHNLALNFVAGSGANETYQEMDILIKLDLAEVPKPVRHIPLYEPVRDGWGQIGFAGSVYTGLWPWVYSPNLGWLRFAEGDGRRIWMHDRQLGWLLTDALMFPYFFGPGEGEVYYLDMRRGEVTPGERHFYAFHLGRWMD